METTCLTRAIGTRYLRARLNAPTSPRLDGAPFSVLQFPRWNILHKEIRA